MYINETQLKRIINNTSEKTLSEKLNRYFLDMKVISEKLNKYGLGEIIKTDDFMNDVIEKIDLLKGLKNLIQEMQINIGNYESYIIYDNDQDFWNNNFNDPYDVVEAIGTDYNFGDDYVYITGDASINSCSSLSEFYNNSAIEEVTKQIATDLKENTPELIDKLNYDNQEVLLKALKK